MRPLIFDDTALIALFHAEQTVYRLWEEAEAAQVTILIPAAVHAANAYLRASDNAWSTILGADHTEPLDLSAGRAVAASWYGQDVVVAHVSIEARDVDATIVTAQARAYDPFLRTVEFDS